ncbi:hypothetical protein L7F22_033871 [Adiantum nelumboides]|nr:hypothetical protein [Adiantum nelumboides]
MGNELLTKLQIQDQEEEQAIEAVNQAERAFEQQMEKLARVTEDRLQDLNLNTEAEPQLVRVSATLDNQFKAKLKELLLEFKDVFAWKYTDMKGVEASFCQHKINLKADVVPVVQQRYMMNPNYAKQVKEEIDKLLAVGFIYPLDEVTWLSPIVVVPKKNAKIRVCVDYRKLNAATLIDPFSLPFCDTLLDAVAGHEIYSFLDGFSGYNQILMAPEDKNKIAFITEWGVYANNVMTFGLKNAPPTFQKVVQQVVIPLTSSVSTDVVPVPAPELHALLELKARTANSATSQKLLRSWNATNSLNICKSWTGVTCTARSDSSGHFNIAGINLAGSELAGSLPPHLGNLSLISTLNLSSNHLTGGIPAELSTCSLLQVLDLSYNGLTGPITPSLSSLSTLQVLILCHNNLSGPIPPPLFTNSTSLVEVSLFANSLTGSISTISSWHKLPRLQKLLLWGNNLTGTIPPSLGNCSSLVHLDLNSNELSGFIPSELGSLVQLTDLVLAQNRLKGAIPASLGGCRNLEQLDLHANQLTGGIPNELGALNNLIGLWLNQNRLTGHIFPSSLGNNCSRLVYLNLNSNQLSGAIPASLGRCRNLLEIALGANQLTGGLPNELGTLTILRGLWLYENHLTGHIPSSLGNCSSLVYLHLYSNQLSGAIPASLGRCRNLQEVALHANQLTGATPNELGTLTNLTGLWLYENNLTGHIPPSLGNSSSLIVSLQLFSNQLSGRIPSELGLLVEVRFLYLHYNHLIGGIPRGLGNCTNLLEIQFQVNQLSGFIPVELGQLAHLQHLSLLKNELKGSIPEILGNCTQLISLQLDANRLSGYIPTEILNLEHLQALLVSVNHILGFKLPQRFSNTTSLRTLNIAANEVGGLIPTELAQLQGLQYIGFGYNQLSGDIPWNSLSNCSLLYYLDLSHNHLAGGLSGKSLGRLLNLRSLFLQGNLLQGTIPESLGGLSLQEDIDLSFNQLNGTLPDSLGTVLTEVVHLNFSHNELSGSLPSWLGSKLVMVQGIDLSHNRFMGIIPESLGQSMSLTSLNLSNNNLVGEFSLHLSNNSNLISLDLSSNQLTGVLPSTLEHLQRLRFLNVSFNNFEGPIPLLGVFKHLNASCFQGNPGLCGPIIQKPCMLHEYHAHSGWTWILVALATSILLTTTAIMAICCYRYRCSKSWLGHGVESLAEIRHFSAKGLLESTQGYSETNLIGEGAMGVVYKGVLSNGEVIAVKKFRDGVTCSREALLQEVCFLSKLRHRNLVKVLGCVLNLEVNALVLEFMPNGSLEQYLMSQLANHEDERHERLNWAIILKIAQGVANALAYLHHEYETVPIIHGDVKPSNILLDSELEAHLADFGLAKLATRDTGAASLTSNFKGSIGYMAPEFAYTARITSKVDIYSFGVVILEMVTGRGPTDELLQGVSLHEWVKHKLHDGGANLQEIVHASNLLQSSSSNTESDDKQVQLLLQMAVECTEELPSKRPAMQHIKAFLDSQTMTNDHQMTFQ